MHKQIFITGIDTDCGKTFITGHLARNIRNMGVDCITSKFIQTGCKGVSEDIIAHRTLMGMELLPEDLDKTTCPIVYSFPASPHLAAEIDECEFKVDKVLKGISELSQKYELVLIEGAGGITVPLSHNYFTSDYLKESKIPVVLVSSSKLGSLNHTLLSIEFCKSQGIQLKAIIYNQFPEHDATIAEDSFLFLQRYLQRKHPDVQILHNRDMESEQALGELIGKE